ncbi:MAG: glycosyltransferase family 2 protein [Candidatus Faecousia sp.]|nr:glycosyltransferase family 2 protein [Candidatus Faecousia sp.]
MAELISLIVPCYNEEPSLPYFWEQTTAVMAKMDYLDFEVIFVNDGSRDKTLEILRSMAEADSRVKYISFSRNFGKEAAMFAGLEHAKGDYAAVMDADLQDPPALLEQMYHAVTQEGYDSAATRRVTRKGEPPIRSFFARMFYRIINKMTDVEIVDGARDFRLMNRKFLNALLELKERNRFSKGLFGWVGFKTKWLEFENVERVAGETKWSFWKLFKYSIEGIVAFTTTPLTIASVMGFFMCMLALCSTVFIVVRKLIFGDPVSGWASTASIITFIGGIQLFFMGVFGQYLAKAYTEIKNRPIYLVAESNLEEEN